MYGNIVRVQHLSKGNIFIASCVVRVFIQRPFRITNATAIERTDEY